MRYMAATARHGAMGRFALLESAGLSRYLASDQSDLSALTVDPPGGRPGHSRTVGYAPSGTLVEGAPAMASTLRHAGSCPEFSHRYPPARADYLATGLGQYGQFTPFRALLFLQPGLYALTGLNFSVDAATHLVHTPCRIPWPTVCSPAALAALPHWLSPVPGVLSFGRESHRVRLHFSGCRQPGYRSHETTRFPCFARFYSLHGGSLFRLAWSVRVGRLFPPTQPRCSQPYPMPLLHALSPPTRLSILASGAS